MTKSARAAAKNDNLTAVDVPAKEHEEALLDQAVAQTFPASDPISPAYEKSLEPVGMKRSEQWRARLRQAAPALLIVGVASLAIFIASNTFLRDRLSETARRWARR